MRTTRETRPTDLSDCWNVSRLRAGFQYRVSSKQTPKAAAAYWKSDCVRIQAPIQPHTGERSATRPSIQPHVQLLYQPSPISKSVVHYTQSNCAVHLCYVVNSVVNMTVVNITFFFYWKYFPWLIPKIFLNTKSTKNDEIFDYKFKSRVILKLNTVHHRSVTMCCPRPPHSWKQRQRSQHKPNSPGGECTLWWWCRC